MGKVEVSGSASFIVVEKPKALKPVLKAWNQVIFGNVELKKKEDLGKISGWDEEECSQPLSGSELEEREVAKGITENGCC